jgi:hypothetical protein
MGGSLKFQPKEKEMSDNKPEIKLVAPDEQAAPHDPLSIFDDLDALRAVSVTTVERRHLLTDCKCTKPDANLYFRSHPDLRMRLPATLIRHKQERDLYYYVTPAMRTYPLLEKHIRPFTLVLITTWPIGEPQLWPVPVLVGDKPFPTDVVQNKAFETSLRFWTQLAWNAKKRNYSVEVAEQADDRKPVWPEEPFDTFLKLAFNGRVIDNDNHEYVRQLRGIFSA